MYLLRSDKSAVLVDFGDGAILEELPGLGVRHISDILMTHYHRDQGQGLARALSAGRPEMNGTRIWVPHTEQDLFHSVEAHWQSRALLNNYDMRQDRFSLLEAVPIAGTLQDYRTYSFGGVDWQVIPTPGHTPGSISLLAEVDGQHTAFTGDLIAGPGKVWSMAALQWSYQKMEGAAALILSLVDLRSRDPQRLLPSHGEIMSEPAAAMDLLVSRLGRLVKAREENPYLFEWLPQPYERITPHLLRNRSSLANSYVLLSESGKALFIDYGYDFVASSLLGLDRTWHRPWLYSLPALKRDFGVSKVDVVIATHYHDDHVAGINLLREVEGAQVWAADTFADVLRNPESYDLPCLWFEPIPVDRCLPAGQEITWEEFVLTVYPLPGHTQYAVAIAFEVDGKRVLATGDQYKGQQGLQWNYVYQNRFAPEDYRASADFFARIAPDLILPGHWDPLWVSADYFQVLHERAETLVRLHQDLLPEELANLNEGYAARMTPYHWVGTGGRPIDYQVEVRNPFSCPAVVRARLVLPSGWESGDLVRCIDLAGGQQGEVMFQVTPPHRITGRRFRIAVDLTAGEQRLGQQAEALVDLI